MRRRLPIALLGCLTAAAACGDDPAGLPPIVAGDVPPTYTPYISLNPFDTVIGENASAVIPGFTFDPDTVVSMEWRLAPEPPDPARGRGTIPVPQQRTAVEWTARIDPVPPRSDYAITFTAVNRRGVRRDLVFRTGLGPSVPQVSVAAPPAPGDTVSGPTVRLAVTVVSRDPILNLDVIADERLLLAWTPDDGATPAWPRHTPFTIALRATLPTMGAGAHTLRVRALDRVGRTGLSPALPLVVR